MGSPVLIKAREIVAHAGDRALHACDIARDDARDCMVVAVKRWNGDVRRWPVYGHETVPAMAADVAMWLGSNPDAC